MNIAKIKGFFTTSSSDLLSAADKQLALSNSIGIGARFVFDASLRSNRSVGFKTAAAYAGFSARGANYLWKQSLVERLPLSEKYPYLKKALSPWAGAAANGGAWTLSQLKEKYTAQMGWGLCQIQPLASTAAVGCDSVKKIRKAWNSAQSRPLDAAKAIGVHGFNLGCELWQAFSEWNGWGSEAWAERQEFFLGKEREFRFIHEVSDAGMKIAADCAASKEALGSYRQNLVKIEEKLAQSTIGASPQNLADTARAADIEAIVVKKPTSPELYWQDYFAAQTTFEDSVAQMNQNWQNAWTSWEKRAEQEALVDLAQFNQNATIAIESSQTLGDLLQLDVKRTYELKEVCRHVDLLIRSALVEAQKLDAIYFSSQKPVEQIGKFVERMEQACAAVGDALKNEIQLNWEKKTDAIGSQWLNQLEEIPAVIGKTVYRVPFDKMYGVLKAGEAVIRRKCGNWTEPFQSVLHQTDLSSQDWATQRTENEIREIQRVCEDRVKELKKNWDFAYLDRTAENAGILARAKLKWDIGLWGWWSGVVPNQAAEEKR